MRLLLGSVIGGWAVAGSAAAEEVRRNWCCGAKFSATFFDAAIEIQLLTVGLFGVAAAALAAWGRALARRRKGEVGAGVRTLAFLGAWRAGSLLLAAGGIAYLAMNFFVAVYAYPAVASYHAYAPGFAEMAMVLWAGLTAAAVSTLTHAHLKARAAA